MFSDHFVGAEGEFGNGNVWKFLRKIGFSDQFFGAVGARNFGKFRYFSETLPNFVKIEAFIA